MALLNVGGDKEPVQIPIKPRPLRETLTADELRKVLHPEATKDLILSYKQELAEANKEAGAWQAKAQMAERAYQAERNECEALRRQLAGIQKANSELNRRCNGPQPIEVAR